MKTTLDLPDDLLIEAKSVAARRHTTLKAIVEHALRREIQQFAPTAPAIDDKFELTNSAFWCSSAIPTRFSPSITSKKSKTTSTKKNLTTL